jgi:hypothetical protein
VSGRIVIGGAIAQKPGCAGHAWQFLQYLLGFRRLGYEVLFLDQLRADGHRAERGLHWLTQVMAGEDLDTAWSLDLGARTAGMSRRAALRFLADADAFINVMGFITDDELLAAARCRVFLDTDPGFGQMWCALGLADLFAGHDIHVTIGERIGRPDCTVPDLGLPWLHTPQPVVLDRWPVQPPGRGRRFTSVASFRGSYGPVEYDGQRYGLRVHELRQFATLPLRADGEFELALDIAAADAADARSLRVGGWRLIAPAAVASTPGDYRRYIQASEAEVMVAKEMYVRSASGWLSERSLCYLASGRPVLAQDTGFSALYPADSGLLAFRDLDEAVAGIESIRSAPDVHAAAAHEIAREHFGSDQVLGRLLEQLGAGRPVSRAAA